MNRQEIEPRRQTRNFSLDDLFRETLADVLTPLQAFGTVSTRDVPTLAVDISETDDRYEISVDAPGMSKEDIDIEISGNRLLIAGERKEERTSAKGQRSFSEVRYGRVERAFMLPEDADPSVVDASYDNGVLRIDIPRRKADRPSKVQIKEGRPQTAALGTGDKQPQAQMQGQTAGAGLNQQQKMKAPKGQNEMRT